MSKLETRRETPSSGSDLECLIELEARLETQLAAVEREAEQRVARAEGEAERLRASAATELAEHLADLRRREKSERERLEAELEADAGKEAARYDSMPEAEVDGLAALVLECFFARRPVQ